MTDRAAQGSISAVIFDFGGVLSNDPFKVMAAYATEHGFDLGEFGNIAIGRGDYAGGDHPWHRLERGEIETETYNHAIEAIAKERGHQGFPPLPVDRLLGLVVEIRPAMLELLADLRSRGIATAILTNNVRVLRSWRDSADWDQLVDAIIDSCEVGMRKPEPRIFEHACATLGVAPTEAAFLDDMQLNVDAAADLGMTGILVADPTDAIAAVRQLIWS